jgi:hypothetical protein
MSSFGGASITLSIYMLAIYTSPASPPSNQLVRVSDDPSSFLIAIPSPCRPGPRPHPECDRGGRIQRGPSPAGRRPGKWRGGRVGNKARGRITPPPSLPPSLPPSRPTKYLTRRPIAVSVDCFLRSTLASMRTRHTVTAVIDSTETRNMVRFCEHHSPGWGEGGREGGLVKKGGRETLKGWVARHFHAALVPLALPSSVILFPSSLAQQACSPFSSQGTAHVRGEHRFSMRKRAKASRGSVSP